MPPCSRHRDPRRRSLSGGRLPVRAQRRARQVARRGLRRRTIDDAARDRRRRLALADGCRAAPRSLPMSPTSRCSCCGCSAFPRRHVLLLFRDAHHAARRRDDLLYGHSAHRDGALGAAAGEKVERFRWIAVAVGFAGVVIALRPTPQMFSWTSPLALFGATMFALGQTLTRNCAAPIGCS